MKNTEWENKFSSIVKETESNLAKMKQRLDSSRNSPMFSSSMNPTSTAAGLYGSNDDRFSASTPTWMPQQNPYEFSMSGMQNKQMPNPPPLHMSTTGLQGEGNSLDASFGVSVVLSDRLDTQSKTISTLNNKIRTLENEKEHFNKQLKDLRDELGKVGRRVEERGVNLQTERKVEQWKHEVMSEVSLLHSQVQMQRSQDSDRGTGMSDMAHVRSLIKDEFASLKMDMDFMRTKLEKVESWMDRLERGHREVAQRQDRLENRLQELGHLQWSTSQNVARDMRKVDGENLRSSLQFLENRLETIETRVKTSNTSRPPRKSPKKKRSVISDLASPNTTDIDLSDLSDLDLGDTDADGFSPPYMESKEYEFSDPGVTSMGLLSDLKTGELSAAGYLSGDTLDHTLSIEEL